MNRWVLQEDGGNWEVQQDGRTVYSGTYEECEDYVRTARAPRDSVTRIEDDGYRWDLTTHLR